MKLDLSTMSMVRMECAYCVRMDGPLFFSPSSPALERLEPPPPPSIDAAPGRGDLPGVFARDVDAPILDDDMLFLMDAPPELFPNPPPPPPPGPEFPFSIFSVL
jgi:hypothetical protein